MSTREKAPKPSPGAAAYFAKLVAEEEAERVAGLSDLELRGEDAPSAEELLAGAKAKAAVRTTSRETPASKVVPIGLGTPVDRKSGRA
jgi:hypothetical protein